MQQPSPLPPYNFQQNMFNSNYQSLFNQAQCHTQNPFQMHNQYQKLLHFNTVNQNAPLTKASPSTTLHRRKISEFKNASVWLFQTSQKKHSLPHRLPIFYGIPKVRKVNSSVKPVVNSLLSVFSAWLG